jgi:hypothetical protein
LIVLLAVSVLALPGKRADPAEAADALAALREARAAKRDARGQSRPARRAGLAAAGLGGATRLAMTRRRGRRQEADGDGDFGADELPENVPVAEWPVGETASGPGVAGLAAQDFPDYGDEEQAPDDQGQREYGDGDHDRGDRGRVEERAPWDMAGDWGSGGGRVDQDPWGDDPLGVSARPGADERREPAGRGDAADPWSQADQGAQWGRPGRRSLTGPQAALSATGSRPAVRPWDPSDQGAPTGWNRDTGEWEVAAPPAEPAYPAETGSGSGPWPAASVPDASTVPDTSAAAKPERHSHRASKHGKPSRWRGSADRSGSGGES